MGFLGRNPIIFYFMEYYSEIRQLIGDEGKTIKQIFSALGLKKGSEKDAARAAITQLERDCVLFCDGGRYIPFKKAGLIKGELRCHERGYAFLVPENRELSDFFIPPRALNGAIGGEIVFVKPKSACGDGNDEAEVVRIVKRRESLVGVYQAEQNYGFVIPDDRGFLMDVFIPYRNAHGAVTGDKVSVKLLRFPSGRNPEGEIDRILGKQYEPNAEERAILVSHGIPENFPQDVIDYAEGLTYGALNEGDRADFRHEQIITIDGESARDLDDAISLKTLENGHFLLGVHIADVSYYVPEDSSIDREALRRGTSVYLPDAVIPMLPRALSNGLCSLNEGEDKFTLSCVMEVDGEGNVVDYKICESVIRSCHRMTYTAVDSIINGDEATRTRYADILPLVERMKALTEILISKRAARGSVDLDVKEADIFVDASGEISITPLNRTLSHRMIEEFMILANETVAEFVRYAELPFLYRVHEAPSAEKVADFADYLKHLGISVKWSNKGIYPKDFAKLLDRVEGTNVYPLVNRVMLRTMSKAKYYPENLGHFGLAGDCYCHFTSPIRRYPDLVVHRALKHVINGRIGEWVDKYSENIYDIAQSTSECERRADEAERDADDLFKAYYMKKHIGEEFSGIVSGVTAFGVFVELKNTVEGLIKIETLPRARYVFDKKSYSLSSGRLSFRLGEEVNVMVAGVSMAEKKVEFIFINKL